MTASTITCVLLLLNIKWKKPVAFLSILYMTILNIYEIKLNAKRLTVQAYRDGMTSDKLI